MSTKIYDAYEFTGTIQELNDSLFKMRKRYYTHCFTELDSWGKLPISSVEKLYIKNKDILSYNKYCILQEIKTTPDKPINTLHPMFLTYALGTIMESRLNDPLNFHASSVVYFHKDDIFVQFFGLPRKFKLDKRLFDFHYQNSSDRDDNVSEKDWEDRQKTWDCIFKKSTIPSVAGFTFLFLDQENLLEFCFEYERWRNKK